MLPLLFHIFPTYSCATKPHRNNGDKDLGLNLHRKLQSSVKNSQAWRIFLSRMSNKWEFEKLFSELLQKLCEWTYLIPQVKQCMYQSNDWTEIQVFFSASVIILSSTTIQQVVQLWNIIQRRNPRLGKKDENSLVYGYSSDFIISRKVLFTKQLKFSWEMLNRLIHARKPSALFWAAIHVKTSARPC